MAPVNAGPTRVTAGPARVNADPTWVNADPTRVTAGPTWEQVVADLHFPTGLTFGESGELYVAESGLPFGGAPRGGRVWRIDGDRRELLIGDLRPPVNGVTCQGGALYITEAGHPSRILRLDLASGAAETVIEGFPGPGNYQTNMVAFGPDGRLYFSQGAMTNTGVIGLDAYELGWLKLLPHARDVPGLEVAVAHAQFATDDLREGGTGRAVTGPFADFGTVHPAGTRIPARLPCSSAVMRCNPDGSDLELVAWGLRNAFGLLFLRDGRLLATDQGADDRGSRPVGNVPELLYEVREGGWYGWPDFVGGVPISDPRFAPEGGEVPAFVLENHDELPPPERPLAQFTSHTAAAKLDEAPDGRLVIAMFGDEVPMTAPSGPRVGRNIAIVDPASWEGTFLPTPTLQRPLDVKLGPDGDLYALDFGHFEPARGSLEATAGSGSVQRCAWPAGA
jgi:glucose/arabinose dehydrogenase